MGKPNVFLVGPNRFNASPNALKATAVVAHNNNGGELLAIAVVGYNTAATDKYIQLFDAATIPANNAVPLMQVVGVAHFPWSFDFVRGRPFKTGVFVCVSTTDNKLTADATVDQIIDIQALQR